MKKLSLLLMLLTVAFTALAGVKSGAPSRLSNDSVWGDEYKIFKRTNLGSAVNPETHTYMVPQDGTIELLLRDGGMEGYVKNIVYGSDRELGDYWVVCSGDQEGGIFVPMGQKVWVRKRDGSFSKANAKLVWGSIHYDAVTQQTSFTPNTEMSGAHYSVSVDGTTIILEGTSGPVAIEAQDEVSYDATGIGLVWDEAEGEEGEWTGYCEWGTCFDTAPCVIDQQPVGQVKTYKRTSDCIHFAYSDSKDIPVTYSTEALMDEAQIVFGEDGKTVYLKDPILSVKYNSWVQGELNEDGSYITINTPQLLDATNENVIFFIPGSCCIQTVYPHDSAPYDYLYVAPYDTYTHISYYVNGNTIMLTDTWSHIDAPYPENVNAAGVYTYDYRTKNGCIEANIVYTLEGDEPQTTSKPAINGHAGNEGGYVVEITPSEPSTIYYRVHYPDGETTNWEVYAGELNFSGEGTYKVEAYAKAENKEPSEIVDHEFTIDPVVTGISELTNGKTIVGKRYFNVVGQEIQQPEGVTIVVTTYSDGTSSAEKVVK